MSELTKSTSEHTTFRLRLLATASAAAFGLSVSSPALADGSVEHSTVWLELGGQLEQLKSTQEPYTPSYLANLPDNYFSPLNSQKSIKSAFGGEGSIGFEPEGSEWVFSASVRFGRANSVRQQHQQTPNAKIPLHVSVSAPPYFVGLKYAGSYYPRLHVRFEDAKTQQSETHAIMDFQAGKDVGLGLFGRTAASVISAGVRYAQFESKSSVSLAAIPDLQYPTAAIANKYELNAFKAQHIQFHAYSALASAQRSFRGIGPSLAWKGDAPFAGTSEQGEMTFDWGLNGAVLFGRQKAKGHHQSTVKTYHFTGWARGINGINGCTAQDACEKSGFFGVSQNGPIANQKTAHNFDRSRMAVIPNLGGFAGMSVRWSNAKVSLGYRADFFFGAMDSGMDIRKSQNLAYFGPFASISVGLGG